MSGRHLLHVLEKSSNRQFSIVNDKRAVAAVGTREFWPVWSNCEPGALKDAAFLGAISIQHFILVYYIEIHRKKLLNYW
jgi:hypothetical protein